MATAIVTANMTIHGAKTHGSGGEETTTTMSQHTVLSPMTPHAKATRTALRERTPPRSRRPGASPGSALVVMATPMMALGCAPVVGRCLRRHCGFPQTGCVASGMCTVSRDP